MIRTLRRRVQALAVLAMLLVTLLAAAAPAHAAGTDDIEAGFVAKINALRTSKGLGPLAVDPEMTAIARSWAAHMAAQGAISHRPNLAAGVTSDWGKLGENVGMGPELDSLFTAFVNSPHHYENLVDPEFNRVGVGVVVANGTIFTAHEFLALRSSPAVVAAPVAPQAAAPARPAAPAPSPAPARKDAAPAALPAAVPAPAQAVAPVATPPAELVGVIAQLHELDQLAA